MTGKPWPEPMVAFAIQQRKDGLSANEIATAIYRKFGVSKTRNMVIGVLHRRQATGGPLARATLETQRLIQKRKPKPQTKPKAEPRPDPSAPVLSPNPRDWRLDRTMNECAYLVDDNHTACCNPVMGGPTTLAQRYCAGHYARMVDWGKFKPISARRQEQHAVVLTRGERIDPADKRRRDAREVGKWG